MDYRDMLNHQYDTLVTERLRHFTEFEMLHQIRACAEALWPGY
jgi:hypothetical protein